MRQLSALVDAAAAHQFTVTVIPSARPELLRSARVDAVYAPDARESDPLLAIAAAQSIPVITNDHDDMWAVPKSLIIYDDTKDWIDTSIEARGIKLKITKIDIPVSFSSAFEGEIIRKEHIGLALQLRSMSKKYWQ